MDLASTPNQVNLPEGCPEIPDRVAVDNLVAIVTIHDPEAFIANRDTRYRKLRVKGTNPATGRYDVLGCHVYLHRVRGQPTYQFGRSRPVRRTISAARTRADPVLDVYLPKSRVAMNQFTLLPVGESDCWRVQSVTETVTNVNGVLLQNATSRTKKQKNPLPHAIHLDQGRVNHVDIHGLRVDIWLIMPASDLLKSEPNFRPPVLFPALQHVEQRSEAWAQSRYILGAETHRVAVPETLNSYRVLQRFVGKWETAKLYRDAHHRARRDQEFRLFCKEKVDESIVQYKLSVELDGIPAVITASHENMMSYAQLHGEWLVRPIHPGRRFKLATAIIRPLFSALEFLHHHRIIHGSVSWESVLLHFAGDEVDKLLLVNYSSAFSVPADQAMPKDHMINDAQQAMELIEDCCGIWGLRKGPTQDASNEAEMREKTERAEKEHQMVQRVCADFFENKGGDRQSEKGLNLLKLLAKKEMEWSRAKTNQGHNAQLLQIASMTSPKLQVLIDKMPAALQNESRIGRTSFLVPSLGHKWLDDLPNRLYPKSWDLTPLDICAKLRALEGPVKKPWRTFKVTRTFTFHVYSFIWGVGPLYVMVDKESLTSYLVVCCELYPEWRKVIEAEYDAYIAHKSEVSTGTINAFRETLLEAGRLPTPMMDTLEKLATIRVPNRPRVYTIAEEHDVWYHAPSDMFNATQLQRHASPASFRDGVSNNDARCDNFAEVRGEPRIQGCYVPLLLLPAFANALGINVKDVPNNERAFPTLDPSDFSQVPHQGRIVLARIGLAAFATVTRTGDQFSHLPEGPLDIHSANPFLPTYFGDMKVLPRLPNDTFHHPPPAHWSKFKTAEEIEQEAKLSSRWILIPVGPSSKVRPRTPPETSDQPSRVVRLSLPRERLVELVQAPAPASIGHLLSRTLIEREQIRAKARPPTKRTSEEQHLAAGGVNPPGAKRAKRNPARENIGLTTSFLARNPNMKRSPPRRGLDPDQTFTPFAPSDGFEEDQEKVKEWLENLTESDDSNDDRRLTNFRIHRDSNDADDSNDEQNSEVPPLYPPGSPTEVASSLGDPPAATRTSTSPSPHDLSLDWNNPYLNFLRELRERQVTELRARAQDASVLSSCPGEPVAAEELPLPGSPGAAIRAWEAETRVARAAAESLPDTDVPEGTGREE